MALQHVRVCVMRAIHGIITKHTPWSTCLGRRWHSCTARGRRSILRRWQWSWPRSRILFARSTLLNGMASTWECINMGGMYCVQCLSISHQYRRLTQTGSRRRTSKQRNHSGLGRSTTGLLSRHPRRPAGTCGSFEPNVTTTFAKNRRGSSRTVPDSAKRRLPRLSTLVLVLKGREEETAQVPPERSGLDASVYYG